MEYRIPILLIFIAGTYAGPAGRQFQNNPPTQSCSKTCTASNKFSYTTGSTYEYKYEVQTKTSMLGASGTQSLVKINAIAEIEVLSKCEMILNVRDVKIVGYDFKQFKDQDKSGTFAGALQNYPLRFSFQDGTVETVCPHADEADWALNIKRGILSTFQNSMDNFAKSHSGIESDVTGKCLTDYKVVSDGWMFVSVKKTKQMDECTHRQDYESAIQSTPFKISSGMKSLPILKSTHECDIEINKNEGTLASIQCFEMHILRPFSKESSGAATEIGQSLSFIRATVSVSNAGVEPGRSQALYFEHSYETEPTKLTPKEALTILRGMCKSTEKEIEPETPSQFSDLVSTMKRMDYNGLKRVYNQVHKSYFCKTNPDRVRKFAMDAFPMVGTDASVELMKTLVSNEDVKGGATDLWLGSLAFIQRPTVKMVQEVAQLTGLPFLSTKVLLPLSALVHSYCQVNPECEQVQEVKTVLDEIERNIQGGCDVTQDNFRITMLSLRAIGNTGHAEASVPSLYNCMMNRNNPMDIRVAAVQAFRRLSCGTDRNNMMAIYLDMDEDPELRIAAYLGVMKCPNPYIISQVLEVHASESVNQVGSFVWSHLSNLLESSDPANKHVQQLLSDAELDNEKFDMDKTKFSRNYEGSFFVDRINAGAKVDSNLVWSPKSFVPRSGYLNLTTSLFGESMNLFEMGGRVEGLDFFLESYFGPMGYFNRDGEKSNDVPESDPKLARLSGRKFRDIRNNAKETFKADPLRGAMFMRMFGNEMSYNMFGANNGINKETKSESDMLAFLNKLKNNEPQDISLSRSFMFLDSTYTVPTMAGLPLKLTVNGTATVAVSTSGQLDFKKPSSNVLVEGNIEPSGAVEIDSLMSVDAFVTRGGLKMKSTLHTSTGAKARVQVTDGRVLDLTFDFTKEKQEVVDIKNSFFLIMNEKQNEDHMAYGDKIEKSMCTGEKVKTILGMEFCTKFSMPNTTADENAPYFPFSGPASATVTMQKKDLPNGYKFEAKNIKTPVQTLFRVLSDTPGSEADRAVSLDVSVAMQAKTLDVNFMSPWKKATLYGQLIDTKKMKGLVGKLSVDDGERDYNLDAKISIDETPKKITYKPVISFEIPDKEPFSLTGVMMYVKKQSFDTDLTLTGALDNPIKLQATVMNTDTESGARVYFNHTQGEGYTFEAVAKKKTERKKIRTRHTYTPKLYVRSPTEELISADGTVIYIEGKSIKANGKIQKLLKKDITLNADISNNELKKNRKQYKAQVKMDVAGKATKFTFHLDNKQGKNFLNRIRFDYNFGRGLRDTLILINRVKLNMAKTKKIVKVTSNFNSMKNDELDSQVSVNFATTRFLTSVAADVKYGKNMKSKTSKDSIILDFEAKHKLEGVKKTVNYTVDFKFPAKSIDVKLKGGHITEDKVIIEELEIQYHPKRSVSLGLRLHNKTAKYPNFAGQLSIGLPESRAMSFAGAFGRESEDKYISSIEFEVIKGRRTRIDSMLKLASESLYEAEVGVQLPDLEPVRVFGGFNKQDNGFKAQAWFKRGEKLYSVTTEAMLDREREGKFLLDVIVPSRRVKINLDGYSVDSERRMLVDLQWDADKNVDDRFLFNVTSDYKGSDDFEMAMTLHYPSRTIEFNMKHSSSARYITNVQLSWSPDDKIEMDIIFRNDMIEDQKRTELTAMFTSPFKRLEEVGLSVSLFRDSKQYQTKSSVTWARKKKIVVSATARVPITVNSIDVVGTMTTPFDNVKSMTAQLKHRFSDELNTFALFEWGKNRLSFKTNGKAKFTGVSFESFDGDIDLRTPWEGMRIFLISAEFTNNKQNKITSRLSMDVSRYSFQKKLDKYVIELDMLYNRLEDSLTNKGSLNIKIPGDDVETIWEVNLQRSMQHVTIAISPRRGNNFKVNLRNNWELSRISYKYGTEFQLIIPAESFKELYLTFGFEARKHYVEASAKILKDQMEVFSKSFQFQLSPGSLQLTASLNSVMIGEGINLKIVSSHGIMPYRGNLELQWAERQKIVADSKLIYDEFGHYDTSLIVKTPFPRYQRFSLSSTRKRMGMNWDAVIAFDFGPRQKIQIDTIYRYDHVKIGSLSLKTPFPQFPGLDTSLTLEGNAFNFKGNGDFSVTQYVPKITTDFNWAYYQGTSLSGALNVNSPFPQFQYLRTKVTSNLLGASRVSNVDIEYSPDQKIKIESDYRFTSIETLEGNIKVTSPYTKNKQVQANFKHVGNTREFKTNAKITCECFKRPVFTDTYFSSKSGITSTFNMESPFRGYEKVNWNFQHDGTLQDFHTVAEYETNGQKIKLENIFDITNTVKAQSTLLTPFPDMSRSHIKLSHDGSFPNTQTILMGALNEKEVTADVKFYQKKLYTSSQIQITTPFKPVKNVNINLSKKGRLDDFQANALVEYGQRWQAEIKHKMEDAKLNSRAEIKTPIHQGYDIIAEFNHAGYPLDFESISNLKIGPAYQTTSKTKFTYALPNVLARHEETTVIGQETKISKFNLDHSFSYVKDKLDISTKLAGQTMNKSANLDFGLNYEVGIFDPTYASQMKVKTFAVLQLPVEDLENNQFFYEASVSIQKDKTQINKQLLTFETPLLEKIEFETLEKANLDTNVMSGVRTMTYGADEMKDEFYFEPMKYQYKMTTPFEGYESTTFDIEYEGNLENYAEGDDVVFKLESKVTSSSLPSDIEASVSYLTEMQNGRKMKRSMDLKLDYGDDSSIKVSGKSRHGYHGMKISTPYEEFKMGQVVIEYDGLKSFDFTAKSSNLDEPIEAFYVMTYNDNNLDFKGKFTSGLIKYSNIKAHLKNSKSGSIYKPYLLISWEDEKGEVQEIEVDVNVNLSYLKFKDMTAGFRVDVRSPFMKLNDMKVQYDHQHFVSPMRAKEVFYIKFNGEEYLDMEAELGAVNKFTGSVIFRAPRKMEFKFSGLNEGESVDFDLNLNWNKEERKSRFRLQFGLADDSKNLMKKKIFHIRITNPSRIIAVRNTYEMHELENIQSNGLITWDEENKKEATYTFKFTHNSHESVTVDLEVVGTRTIEVSGSMKKLDDSVVTSGSVYWDAKDDRDKMVEATFTLTRTLPRSSASFVVKIPTVKKELTLKTDIALEQANVLFDGNTQISYSPEEAKTVYIKYNLRQDGSSVSRFFWSLKHAKSATDIVLTSQLTSSVKYCNLDTILKYTTNSGRLNKHQLKVDLDRENNALVVEMSSPGNNAVITGEMTSQSPYVMTLDLQRNRRHELTIMWKVDADEKTLDASMTYDNKQKKISTKALFPNATSFESETTRITDAGVIQDGYATANLEERVLHGHLKWRPEMVRDVLKFGTDCMVKAQNEIQGVLVDNTNDMGSEVYNKYRRISSDLVEEMAPVGESMANEVRLIQRDLREMRKELKKMHKNNELYLATLEQAYSGTVKQVLDGYSFAIQNLGRVYQTVQDATDKLSKKIDEYPLQQKYTELSKELNMFIKETIATMEKELLFLIEQISEKMKMMDALYESALQDMSLDVQEYINALVDEFALSSYLDQLKTLNEKLIDAYPHVDDLQKLRIHKLVNEIRELLIDAMSKTTLTEKYQVMAKKAKEILGEGFEGLLENEDVRDMYELLEEIYKQVMWLYEYSDIDTTALRALLMKITNTAREKIIEEFNQLPIGILDMYKSRFTTFDLENGEVEFDLYLPIPMKNFDEMMKFTVKKYIAKMKGMADKYFPRRDLCLWDFYYQLPPVQWSMKKDWVPPYDAFATVSGLQHYKTWDGTNVDLAGLCSYILVEDLVDGNFSVVQKYGGGVNNPSREALIVMIAGKTVEINKNYMVKVDGKPTELPYEADGLTLYRQGSRILLSTSVGLDIVSDFYNDFHMFGLSGWYYGKVGGLLGTFDNEGYNDNMSPEGSIESQASALQSAWEVDRSCRDRNVKTTASNKRSSECAELFSQTGSSLRPCFEQVDPSSYQGQCDLSPSASCDVAALYVEVCNRQGVTVTLPKSCVKCASTGIPVIEAEEPVQFETGTSMEPHQSMDIVFVVEEANCNRQAVNKLTDIIYHMEQSMSRSGISNNRYSLVGYGAGKVKHHTMEGQLFNQASKFAKGMENLRFDNGKPYTPGPLKALKYATSLPYRPGVTKNIILASCSPCQATYDYSKLAAELHQRDITLHVLRENTFMLKNNRIPNSQVYGIDNKKVFLGRSSSNDNDLFSEINIPENSCEEFALQSNGSVFDTAHANIGSIREQRAFMGEVGDRIAETATDSDCHRCNCELDEQGTPRSVCRRCDLITVSGSSMDAAMNYLVQYKNSIMGLMQA